MVSDLKTFAHKGCKIATQKKVCFSANFALLAGFYWYRCYYPHWSRDALSPVCGSFFFCFISLTIFFSGLWGPAAAGGGRRGGGGGGGGGALPATREQRFLKNMKMPRDGLWEK